jgi:hypothetical protein
MPANVDVPHRGAGGAARPDGRLDLDPPPFPPGEPIWQLWSERLTPPAGLDFLGAVPTARAWLLPCPSCVQGWALLAPSAVDPHGYDLDLTAGCSRDCSSDEVAWWWLWRRCEMPPARNPGPPDERARRYARGAVRLILGELPDRPSERQLTNAAYQAGRWLQAAALPVEPVATALLAAGRRAGLAPDTLAPKLAAALTAGRARPGRLPS